MPVPGILFFYSNTTPTVVAPLIAGAPTAMAHFKQFNIDVKYLMKNAIKSRIGFERAQNLFLNYHISVIVWFGEFSILKHIHQQ